MASCRMRLPETLRLCEPIGERSTRYPEANLFSGAGGVAAIENRPNGTVERVLRCDPCDSVANHARESDFAPIPIWADCVNYYCVQGGFTRVRSPPGLESAEP